MTEPDIKSFPTSDVHPDRVLYRIHRAIHDPRFFCDSGVGRFDLDPSTGAGTCHLGTSELGAFVEALGRTRFLTQDMIDERSLSAMTLTRPLHLADLTDRKVLGQFGIAGDLSVGDDYTKPREWAGRLYEAGFDGIYYAARHDPGFTERSVAVFGNEETGEKLFEIDTEPIPEWLVEEACREFGFTVWPATPLL
jgi:hypothetical protein